MGRRESVPAWLAEELVCKVSGRPRARRGPRKVHALWPTTDFAEAGSGLKPAEIKRLQAAREVLEAAIANPPSVPELASRVGINRTMAGAGGALL